MTTSTPLVAHSTSLPAYIKRLSDLEHGRRAEISPSAEDHSLTRRRIERAYDSFQAAAETLAGSVRGSQEFADAYRLGLSFPVVNYISLDGSGDHQGIEGSLEFFVRTSSLRLAPVMQTLQLGFKDTFSHQGSIYERVKLFSGDIDLFQSFLVTPLRSPGERLRIEIRRSPEKYIFASTLLPLIDYFQREEDVLEEMELRLKKGLG